MKGGIKLGFWDGKQCEYCNGPIIEKIMDLPRKVGENYILIQLCPVRFLHMLNIEKRIKNVCMSFFA